MSNVTQTLPKKAKIILQWLDYHGKKTQSELFDELNFTHRVLRYTLKIMLDQGVIYKQANFMDMRRPYYVINTSTVGYNIEAFIVDHGLAEV
ncbi:MAG: Lrp/AsnC family transcriptional regulator [Candidatus Heimdallarchaeota archaeon]|nr:Lrp/AsnC family transcriptional regulator [Candidatus Heimdallarchaeota archaeon]